MSDRKPADGFLGGKYETAQALEDAYKSQDREVQRLQSELASQKKAVDSLQPIAEILNRPGAIDAVETYLQQGTPKTPEVNIYEGLPDDFSDMSREQFVGMMKKQESQLRDRFSKQADKMVKEAIGGERTRSRSADAERSFRERHGVSDDEDFSKFKSYANDINNVDLQDALYSHYLESLGATPGNQTTTTNPTRPNLPQGAGMGAGSPATSQTPEQAFLDKRKSQFIPKSNEALDLLKAPAGSRR